MYNMKNYLLCSLLKKQKKKKHGKKKKKNTKERIKIQTIFNNTI
jgi:hypothetical protein